MTLCKPAAETETRQRLALDRKSQKNEKTGRGQRDDRKGPRMNLVKHMSSNTTDRVCLAYTRQSAFGRRQSLPRVSYTSTMKQIMGCYHLHIERTQTFFFLFFFHLTYSRWTSSLPSCLWSQIFPSLPGSRLTNFLSRCKFSTLTTRQPMVEFYLLTFPRFPLRKKEHKSYFGKNRTHDFRTSRCAAYLLDHSGDERQ